MVSSQLGSARQAEPEQPHRFQSGDLVRLRTDPARQGIIRAVVGHPWGYDYRVFFGSTEIITYPEDRLDLVPEPSNVSFLTHREFLRDLVLIKMRQRLTDSLYSFRASRTLYRVYQFKPVLKFLNSPEQRILIADEVGLGKTIEAGIILLELKARMDLERVLVVCPSGLKDKWYAELRYRFDEEFTVFDATTLRRFIEDYQRLGGKTRIKGICSLELLRGGGFTRALAEQHVNFDLVVIDEAHHLRNVATLSHALGELLSDQSSALVLLTATPLQTGSRDLFHLMQLINPGEFDNFTDFEERLRPNQFVNAASRFIGSGEFRRALDELRKAEQTAIGKAFHANPYYREATELLQSNRELSKPEVVGLQRRLLELNTLSRVFNRTRKRDVSDAAVRSAHTIKVSFTSQERALYDAIIEFVRWQLGQFRHRFSGNVPIFNVIMRERQVASCIQAVSAHFREALRSTLLTLHVEESSTDLLEEAGELRVDQEGRQHIQKLLSLCEALGDTDTKFDLFHHSLKELLAEDPSSKVLVFSFFRDTLTYLYRRLSELGYRVNVIHGGVPVAERQGIITQFREDSSIHIMLSSEVGAEGLDFQFCAAMFNYDLPWNPMKVEQRIGRLDRFGQEHEKIGIYNLVIDDTIETRIFLRLYDRIHIFETSIGDLEAILGEEIRQLSRDIFMSRLTQEQEIQRAEQAAQRLEWYRQEQEEFEQQRLVFLGQDNLFKEEMDELVDSGRYVAPDEILSLVECYLVEAFPRTRLDRNEDDTSYLLKPDPTFVESLTSFAIGNRQLDQRASSFLQRLHGRRDIPITFEPETARQRKLVEFITVHHPLALAAAGYFNRRGSPSPPVTCIWAKSSSARAGDYAFFVYRLEVACLTPQLTLFPVLIDLETRTVELELASNFLAAVQNRNDERPPAIKRYSGDFSALQDVAVQHVSQTVREREREMTERNDGLVAVRIASLEQSYGFRIANAEHQKAQVDETNPIYRMRQAQIANLKGALSKKKREIESKRQVNVGYELVASGLVRFIPASAPAVSPLQAEKLSQPAAMTSVLRESRHSEITAEPASDGKGVRVLLYSIDAKVEVTAAKQSEIVETAVAKDASPENKHSLLFRVLPWLKKR